MAGPIIDFEYLVGFEVLEINTTPFEFYNNQHEPLYFEFTEEGAVALGELLRQAMALAIDYLGD